MILPNPGFWESLSLFILYICMVVAVLGDCYYTGIGLSKGLTEGNPLNRWLFGKIGQALTCFLEAAFVTFAGGGIAVYSMPAAFIFCPLKSWTWRRISLASSIACPLSFLKASGSD